MSRQQELEREVEFLRKLVTAQNEMIGKLVAERIAAPAPQIVPLPYPVPSPAPLPQPFPSIPPMYPWEPPGPFGPFWSQTHGNTTCAMIELSKSCSPIELPAAHATLQ